MRSNGGVGVGDGKWATYRGPQRQWEGTVLRQAPPGGLAPAFQCLFPSVAMKGLNDGLTQESEQDNSCLSSRST